MNVKTETKYFNIIDREIVAYWYTLECATDYRHEFGGGIATKEITLTDIDAEIASMCTWTWKEIRNQ